MQSSHRMTLLEIIEAYTPESIKQILADHERRKER